MTDQERQQLKNELMKEIIAEIKEQNIKTKDKTATALAVTREKWFRCNDKRNKYQNSVMGKAFDTIDSAAMHKVWELTHKLTCYICGEKRINDLKDTDFANEVAEKLCQTIYDLRVKYIEESRNENL